MTNEVKKQRANKGQVTVRLDSGTVKACFPRNYFADGKQVKLGTGISPNGDWTSVASKLQRRLQLELEENKLSDNGVFNLGRYQEILEEYGLRAKLKLVRTTEVQQTELGLLEIWEMYCEYIRPNLKGSTYQKQFGSRFTNFIKSAIEATESEDALKIRNWLLDNRELLAVKGLLGHLEKAYTFAIKHKKISGNNPYLSMAEEIKTKGDKGRKIDDVVVENDNDLLDRTKAYTWNEVSAILEYVANHNRLWKWYPFLYFKFNTGVRTGEAIALMWGDILWEKEQIVIRRNYDVNTKQFYNTKTEVVRFFPLSRDSELWNLLQSLQPGESNQIVFLSPRNKIINHYTFYNIWHGKTTPKRNGIIPTLIEQGKLTKYLPPYNTRHSFITHQIYDLGRDERIVSAWCGHHIDTSQRHYQDITTRALAFDPSVNANELEELKQQLIQQQEMINKLLQQD